MKYHSSQSFRPLLLAAGVAALGIHHSVRAAVFTWGGGAGNWADANWLPGPVPGPTASTDSSAIDSGTVTLTSNNQINGLAAIRIGVGGKLTQTTGNGWNVLNNLAMQGGTLESAATSVSNFGNYHLPGTVTVSGSIPSSFITNGSGIQYINLDLVVQGGTTFDVADVTSSPARDFTISTRLGDRWDGAASLIKTGTGTMLLSGAHTYSGATTVDGGTLELQDSYASNGFAVSSSAVLELNGGWNGATTTFSGLGTLRKTGTGTSVWGGGAATFSLGSGSLIDVQEGTFTGGSSANENWSSNLSDLNVSSGATFTTVEANVRVNRITGTGTIGTGYSGAGYANLTIGVDNGSSTFGGVIQNTGNNSGFVGRLVKAGSGTIALTGDNTYSGSTTVSAGTLDLSGTNSIGAVTVNGGSTIFSGGNTTINGNLTVNVEGTSGLSFTGGVVEVNQIYSDPTGDAPTAFMIGAGAEVHATGGVFFRSWRGRSGMFLYGGSLHTPYLASNSSTTGYLGDVAYIHFNGTRIVATRHQSDFIQLAGGANHGNENFARLNAITSFDSAGYQVGIGVTLNGSGGLVKEGAGTLKLSGASTYTGGTTVDSGILELSGSSGGTGRICGPLTVSPGAEVRFTNDDGTGFGYNESRISSLSIHGGSVSSAGACHIWSLGGGVVLTGGILSSNDGTSTTTGPPLEWGNTALASNASADTSTVAGRINIRHDAASLLRVNVADGAAATDLMISAALTESAACCGLVKSGAGTLKLSGAVDLTGFITVNGGTLDLSTATPGTGSRINVLSGARFIPPTSGLQTAAMIFVNGEKLAPGIWGAPGSVAAGLAQYETPAIAGSTVVTIPDTGLSNRERWKTLKYGIFSHYTYAATGNDNPDDAANAFNAEQYANDLEQAGVQYVVWTAWHGNTVPMYPSQVMVKYGWPGRFSQRDTVGDMIDAVKAKGIRVYLYTHPYQPITSPLSRHNDFINELYAELLGRYGSRIDGLWIDENQINGDQDSLVDYKRLMTTIKEGNPDLVTMQNGGQMYTADMGGPEVVGSWNFGWSECLYNLANPGQGPGIDDMLRTTVLQAAANFEGGGVHWSIDGVANGGLLETTRVFALGRYLAPIRQSVCNTTPSNSFPPPYKDGRTVSYNTVDWVATTSTDESKEFIHVLKAPSGNTLTLPGTADGKVFSSATLMASLQPGGGTQEHIGLPMNMLQTPRGIRLTLPAGSSWSSLDTVIQLNVASKGGAGMVNNTSAAITYAGSSWTYQNHRGAGEYSDDAHSTTANGDSFTFTFSGTDVDYIATRAANRGPVAVYIDDVFQTTVDLSAGVPLGSRHSVYSKSGLARGIHTLRAVKMGGTYMEVDCFKVTELINDGDADLTGAFPSTFNLGARSAAYSGLWQPGYGNVAWITPGAGYIPSAEPLNGTLPTSGDSFEFSFYGTEAQVMVGSQYSWGYFHFMVDGVFQTNVGVSTNSPQTFSTGSLPLGNHTIRAIVWKSTSDPFQPGIKGFSVTRSDLWNYQANRGYGEIGDDVHYTDINPGGFSLSFTGSGVDVITTRDSDARMAWFGVSGMDRAVGARRNSYSPVRQTGSSVFSMPNLAPGTRSVSVQHGANTSGLNFSFARLAIDALRVYKAESLSAAPLFWGADGNGGSGTWDIGSSANWYDGGQATAWHDFGGNDYAANFAGTAGTVNLASNIHANRLNFKTAAYTLQGNSLTLTGDAPTLAADAPATIASTIQGSSGLSKSGIGTLSITGSNNYSGPTTIAEGTLALSGSYTSSSFTIDSGAVLDINAATMLNLPAVTVSGTGTLRKTGSAAIVWGSSSTSFALGVGSLIDVREGEFIGGSFANETWTNNQSDLNVEAGAVFKTVEANVRLNRIAGSGVLGTGYSGAGYQYLTIGLGGGSSTFDGSITNTDNNPSFVGNVVKEGAGVIILNGINTYTGTTWVNGGTLRINGSTAPASALTVANAATLGGSGTIGGSITVNNGGTLAPGSSVGTLTTGTAMIDGTLAIDLDAAGADKLVVIGNFNIATATLDFNTLAAPSAASYDIVSYTGSLDATAFAAVNNLPPGYQLQFDATNKLIQLVQSLSAFDTWATTTHGLSGADAAFDADTDGDGLRNGLEWILGGNPNSSSPSIVPSATFDASHNFIITFNRLEASISETNLKLEYGKDLSTWPGQVSIGATSTGPDANGVSVSINTAATPHVVTVTIPNSNLPSGRIFTRLNASR